VPLGLANVVAIAAGGGHSLAVVGDGPPFVTVQPSTAVPTPDRPFVCGSVLRALGRSIGSGSSMEQTSPGPPMQPCADGCATRGSGYYAVAVSNEFGSITSASGHLAVINGPPLITDNLTDRLVFVGEAVTIQLMADGSRPFQYQWQFNGVDIAGPRTRC